VYDAPSMSPPSAVQAEGLLHDYGPRRALRGIDFSVRAGEIFALLGPNGGGKTTLFRILATLLKPTGGRASVLGFDVSRQAREVRAGIGVVFQSPALDRKLTVRENLETQGHLYGLTGRRLREAVEEMLRRVRLLDRAGDRVETLSGGLMRRAEIAKGILHRPRLLLLDEPSTGLDPGARQDLWDVLRDFHARDSTTILMTTHLMDEAERCDRLAILSEGSLVACGTPSELKGEIGGDVIVVATPAPESLQKEMEQRFGVQASVVDGTVRLERKAGHELIPRIVEAFPDRIESVTLGKPTLLDVFVRKTGHRFWSEEAR
jgi:ABC-2 type transport system ATP-binding protein